MKDINIVTLQGRLTKDPEMKTSRSGTPWMLFTVAVNDSMKNASGDWEDKADFLLIKAFGKTAEAICNYADKGTLLTITGRLKCDQYESNGDKKSMTYVLADIVRLPPKPKDGGGGGGYQPSTHEQSKANGYAPESSPSYAGPQYPDFGDDMTVDIPF